MALMGMADAFARGIDDSGRLLPGVGAGIAI